MLLQENCGKVNHKLIKKIDCYLFLKLNMWVSIFIKIFILKLCFHMTKLDILQI